MAARSSTGPSTPKKEEICKALFRSPDWNQDEIVGSKTQKSSVNPKTVKTMALMDKLHIEHGIETCCRGMEKDLLQQRLKNLREMAKKLSEDDWRYTPLEQLIGLH
ncbi:hypothetical protein NP493_27g06011 [Ridgeia piscesae]|uniref:Uncharacterized protein n=1 Tax=Ridgeia piscesae TaxID=27915 RepID=A0AAD9PD91_RIDPI|nr:hypothetical protein NP493_27g06011 [Ridgeia piscesae]